MNFQNLVQENTDKLKSIAEERDTFIKNNTEIICKDIESYIKLISAIYKYEKKERKIDIINPTIMGERLIEVFLKGNYAHVRLSETRTESIEYFISKNEMTFESVEKCYRDMKKSIEHLMENVEEEFKDRKKFLTPLFEKK